MRASGHPPHPPLFTPPAWALLAAVTRNPRVAMMTRVGHRAGNQIEVYTAAGFFDSAIPWDGARIVSLGFTDNEQLLVVTEDANVHMFDVHRRKFLQQFNMGKVCSSSCPPCCFAGGRVFSRVAI